MADITDAILNYRKYCSVDLSTTSVSGNRANSMGESLEKYVKDLFAGTFGMKDLGKKAIVQSKVFSYLGGTNSPPDSILKKGDAIEIKKIESQGSQLALNSSYPKQKLSSDNDKISKACKKCERQPWKKDIIYVVGVVPKNSRRLSKLFMVYGADYCAEEGVYSNLLNRIKNATHQTEDVAFEESKEIAHVNSVDPLGITYFRVRGMWGIENPWKVFDYVLGNGDDANLTVIVGEHKWKTLNETNRKEIEKWFDVSNVKVKNPDNPAKLRNAKLIRYTNIGE